MIESPPYEVCETGWGEFAIGIKVHFRDTREAAVSLTHMLKLFHPAAERKEGNKKPGECCVVGDRGGDVRVPRT